MGKEPAKVVSGRDGANRRQSCHLDPFGTAQGKLRERSLDRESEQIELGLGRAEAIIRTLTSRQRILGAGQGFVGLGWTGFGPKARAVSRCGRVVRESARWRANSLAAGSL
jgi:hypothetical protein